MQPQHPPTVAPKNDAPPSGLNIRGASVGGGAATRTTVANNPSATAGQTISSQISARDLATLSSAAAYARSNPPKSNATTSTSTSKSDNSRTQKVASNNQNHKKQGGKHSKVSYGPPLQAPRPSAPRANVIIPVLSPSIESDATLTHVRQKLSEVRSMRRRLAEADIAIHACVGSTAEVDSINALKDTLDSTESVIGTRLLGLLAKDHDKVASELWDDPPPIQFPDEKSALEEAVNYSVRVVPWKFADLARNTGILALLGVGTMLHLPLIAAASAAIYPLYRIGVNAEELSCKQGTHFRDGDRCLHRAHVACDLVPPAGRNNVFIDVAAEPTLQRIGTHYLARKPGGDDVMVYLGYKSSYLTHIHAPGLAHLLATKAGSKLTEINIGNMTAEIALKFRDDNVPYNVLIETAIHAHQVMQAGSIRRYMTCTTEPPVPLRVDARQWNPS